ncbi:hypothetical protein AX769_10735 [Frondihabitans sp. PAMC 28766]|uniref:glycoside hydrolase family 6 protein n=1 Tax=Frondihabitans sp. PAMC 28766 TaxID=1795630 RepID=UPI00078EB753|nr:glycoside hydrolase family 6 protein [Frondihabitans sp. PAMC 28766]AMM20536.1 hypothetical protein AX769_10735 [Frondihabitans sp. PAMC 28766]
MARHRTTLIARTVIVALAASVIAAGIVQGQVSDAGAVTAVPSAASIQRATPAELYSGGLAVQPGSQPAIEVAALMKRHQTAEAKSIEQIASQPVAIWLGDWYGQAQVARVVAAQLSVAKKAHRTATFVTYAIPDRDCGGYSAGGLTASQYLAWNKTIATALRGQRAVVLVEPDSLAMISNCTSVAAQRLPLIKSAVQTLAANGATVYLDAGNSHWVDPATMASRLKAAGIESARGFFTNVSNFYPVADEEAYANKVSALTGGSHYVIDTSRDGQGWKGTWCNPIGAGLGKNPAVSNGRTKLDATLWVKTPGASDGTCDGGPTAGTWWEKYAVALVKNRTK